MKLTEKGFDYITYFQIIDLFSILPSGPGMVLGYICYPYTFMERFMDAREAPSSFYKPIPISHIEYKILHRVMTFTDFNTSFTVWL